MKEFLIENWHWLAVTGYELLVRVVPTSRSWSLVVALSKVLQIIPDRAKKGNGVLLEGDYVHAVRLEKRIK
jgi:hypothetical protein